MALLTHGPRLGDPRSDGFKVWVRTDGAATAVLEVRLNGATAWTTADTQAIDTTKYNTAFLTVTGLTASTLYDYRVTVDGLAGTVYSTRTMPPNSGGNFIVYQTTDCHSAAELVTIFNAISADYATYNAQGIPGMIIQYGDIFSIGTLNPFQTSETATTVATNYITPGIATIDTAVGGWHTLPTSYMWDDWDFGSNNSNRFVNCYYPSADPSAEATKIFDWFWMRAADQEARPSCGYALEIGGVPFVIPDARSQKMPEIKNPSGLFGSYTSYYHPLEPLDDTNTYLGATQRAWLISKLQHYSDRGLVVLVNTHTFKDNVVPYTSAVATGGRRDSTGIFYKVERNAILKAIAPFGYSWRNNLVVWSGDDHWNVVWKGQAGTAIMPGTDSVAYRYNGTDGANYPPAFDNTVNVPFLEFKVSGITVYATNAGNSPVVFGAEQNNTWAAYAQKASASLGVDSGVAAFVRWQINSTNGGTKAEARATYIVVAAGSNNVEQPAPGSTLTDDFGRSFDLYFDNGNWEYYDATNGNQTQLYPPDTIGPQIFQKAYLDDINGDLVREQYATRDQDFLLRDIRDIGDLDGEVERQSWKIRHERPTWEP